MKEFQSQEFLIIVLESKRNSKKEISRPSIDTFCNDKAVRLYEQAEGGLHCIALCRRSANGRMCECGFILVSAVCVIIVEQQLLKVARIVN